MTHGGFKRRFDPKHPGFDPMEQPGMAYRLEKLVGDVWLPVNPHRSLEAALRYAKGKPEWRTRIVRIKDGAVVT